MISIILPCYNPADGWSDLLIENMKELNAKLPTEEVEYIISNDGSTRLNRTNLDKVTAAGRVTFVDHVINEGKGAAIRKGTQNAKGEIIIYTDIDFPFGTQSIVEMIEIFNKNPDCWFVYGNRNVDYFKKLPLKRKIISKILRVINRLFLSRHITDTQAGIKGLRSELLQDILQTKTNTFVFEVELIRKLIRKKIQMRSVEVAANPSIVFSDFSTKILLREAMGLVKIFSISRIWNDVL